jgi:hypothetical protein
VKGKYFPDEPITSSAPEREPVEPVTAERVAEPVEETSLSSKTQINAAVIGKYTEYNKPVTVMGDFNTNCQ